MTLHTDHVWAEHHRTKQSSSIRRVLLQLSQRSHDRQHHKHRGIGNDLFRTMPDQNKLVFFNPSFLLSLSAIGRHLIESILYVP